MQSDLIRPYTCKNSTILTEISQLFRWVSPFERGRKVAGNTSSATGGAFWLISIASNLDSAGLIFDPYVLIRLEPGGLTLRERH
jgi:hypothetical protein